MKHTVRSFSVGLLTSGVILLIAFYFIGDPVQSAEDLEPEEMIPVIEDKGYTVLTKDEYISLSVSNEPEIEETLSEEKLVSEDTSEENPKTDSKEQSNASEEAEAKQEESEEPTSTHEDETEESSVRYTLTISPGMASSDISSLLAEYQIIENASEFNSYLDEHDYSLKVQIGSYDLSSDMSFYQIAEKISN
ncbi:hypothetical protein ACFOUV_03030 [Oceanobacillus longus]|uniref:YceG-like family protein n=1 Tax=Oceanobacillus longus TaxID=930120 RepID=A0ABV8GSU2_9BACI